MAYPQKLLGEGERVEMELRPHWRAVVPAVVLLLVVVPVASFLAAVVPDWAAQRWIRLALAVLALVLLAWGTLLPLLRWITQSYTLTTRRIIVRSGLLTRTGHDMPMSRVTDVSFRQGVLDRIMRTGTLTVESSGERGQLVLLDVPNVQVVQREIYRLHEQDDDRRRERTDPEVAHPGDGEG